MLNDFTPSFLKRGFAVAALGLLTGCATICGTRECRLEETARTMLKDTDIGVKATAVKTLMKIHPELETDSHEVREALVPREYECTASDVVVRDGKKIFKMTDCAGKKSPLMPAPFNF